MRSSIALLAAPVIGALAKDTMTTSLFLGGGLDEGQKYAGSVVSAGPSDTVYELVCTATDVCGTYSLPVRLSKSQSFLILYTTVLTRGTANPHRWPIAPQLPIRH